MAKVTNKSQSRKTMKTVKVSSRTKTTKKPVVSGSFISSYKKLSRKNVAILAVAFAVIGISTLIYSFAFTPSTIIDAKKLTFTGATAPQGKMGISMLTGGTGTATFKLPSDGISVNVLASGTACDGPPEFDVQIDGVIVSEQRINSSVTSTYKQKLTTPIPKGDHTVVITYRNDYAVEGRCDRNLYIQKIVIVRAVPVIATPSPTPTPTPDPTPTPTPDPTPTPTPNPNPGTSNDFTQFYNPESDTLKKGVAEVAKTDAAMGTKLQVILNTPHAYWVGGYSGEDKRLKDYLADAKAKKQIMPITIYNVSGRDNGQYSSGGVSGEVAYQQYIDNKAAIIGDNRVMIFLEPDGVALSQPDAASQDTRYRELTYATKKLGALPNARVYIDAGTPGWKTPEVMAERVYKSGVENITGFMTNSANFHPNDEVIRYGNTIAAQLKKNHGLTKSFVIDTSANGVGNEPRLQPKPATPYTAAEIQTFYDKGRSWCNPPNRGLGKKPTLTTGVSNVDAFIWIYIPGTSNGSCIGTGPGHDNPDPVAGAWFPRHAIELVNNAVF